MWNYVYPSYELYHHGVLGQKWGKRNGPPYPLTAGAHSSSEKKAGWKKSLSGGSGDKVRYGNQPSKSKANGSKVKESKSSSKSKKDVKPIKKQSVFKALKKKISSITPEQKAKAKKIVKNGLLILAGVAIAATLAYFTLNGARAMQLKQAIEKADKLRELISNTKETVSPQVNMIRSQDLQRAIDQASKIRETEFPFLDLTKYIK